MSEYKRGSTGLNKPVDHNKVGLPPRPFLYTIDQIAVMIGDSERSIHINYIYHMGRDIGTIKRSFMQAFDISKPDEKPEWRVTEREFIRWMRNKGFKYYDRGVFL